MNRIFNIIIDSIININIFTDNNNIFFNII